MMGSLGSAGARFTIIRRWRALSVLAGLALGPAAALGELRVDMAPDVFVRAGIDASDGDRGARRWLPRRAGDAVRRRALST